MGKRTLEDGASCSNHGAAAKHELAVDCIYVALLQLMETKPYESITVTDICKRAGVSRMAYYRNYANKDEILTSRLDSLMEDTLKRLEQGRDVDKHVVVAGFFRSLQSSKVVLAIVRAGLTDKVIRIILAYARRAYQNVLQLDLSSPSDEMHLYQLTGAMAGLILYLTDNGDTADPEELATRLVG